MKQFRIILLVVGIMVAGMAVNSMEQVSTAYGKQKKVLTLENLENGDVK